MGGSCPDHNVSRMEALSHACTTGFPCPARPRARGRSCAREAAGRRVPSSMQRDCFAQVTVRGTALPCCPCLSTPGSTLVVVRDGRSRGACRGGDLFARGALPRRRLAVLAGDAMQDETFALRACVKWVRRGGSDRSREPGSSSMRGRQSRRLRQALTCVSAPAVPARAPGTKITAEILDRYPFGWIAAFHTT